MKICMEKGPIVYCCVRYTVHVEVRVRLPVGSWLYGAIG